MESRKKFAFDVSITFIASAITMFAGFVITILLGRYLGSDDLGIYRLIYTIYGLATLIATIGISSAIIKYIAEYKENKNTLDQFISSVIINSLFLGIGTSIIFYFVSSVFAEIFHEPELSPLLRILSLVFPFVLVKGIFYGLLNGIREMKKYAIVSVFENIFLVIVTITLVYNGFGINGSIIGIVLSSIISCLVLILICKSYFKITFYNYRFITKKILSFGVQILGADVINTINLQADMILVGYFLTANDVGYYSVSVGLSRFFWLIPQALQKITYPTTSEYWAKNNHEAMQKMIDKSMRYTAFILIPVGLGFGFFAKEIIVFIFGEEFISAILPFQILIIGTIAYGLIKTIGGSLSGIGQADINLKVTAFGALIDVICMIILIPIYGIIGAAIATIISFITVSFLFIYLTLSIMKIKIDLKWYGIILMITIFTIVIYLLNQNRYITFLLFGCYCIVFFFLIKKEERKILTSLILSLFSREK